MFHRCNYESVPCPETFTKNGTELDDLDGLTRMGIWWRRAASSNIPLLKTETKVAKTAEEWYSLPLTEQHILSEGQSWLSTPYAVQLANLVSQVIEDRKDSPISNAVLLGVGGAYHFFGGIGQRRDVQQFVAFSQICALLARACPSMLENIVVQDPNMTPDWKAAFEARGCKVVEDPEAFDHIGQNTFLFSAWVRAEDLFPRLEGLLVHDLALYISNDLESKTISRDLPEYTALAGRLFDRTACMVAPVPCADLFDETPGKDKYGNDGLGSLFLWWRPLRDESEHQRDRARRSFGLARELGFPRTFEEFYRSDSYEIYTLSREKQDRLIYIYIVQLFDRGFYSGPFPCSDFWKHVKNYKIADAAGVKHEERYENSIDIYMAALKNGTWAREPDMSSFPRFLDSEQSRSLQASWGRQLSI